MNKIRKLCLFLLAASSTALAPAGEAAELTMDLVESRITTLRAGGAGDDDDRVQAYVQVRNLLSQADAYAAEAQLYVDAVSKAPQRAAEIQRRLDDRTEPYDPAKSIDGFAQAEPSTRRALALAEQREAAGQLETLERRLADRETTTSSVRSRIAEIDARLTELPVPSGSISVGSAPSLAEAQQWAGAAETLALGAERRARQAELASLPERYNLMAAERAALALRLEDLNRLNRALELSVADDTRTNDQVEDLDLAPNDPAYDAAAALLERIREVRARRTEARHKVVEVRTRTQELSSELRTLSDRYSTARRVVDFAGDSDVLGQVLLSYWEDVEDLAPAKTALEISDTLGRAVISRIGHEVDLAALTGVTTFVEDLVRSVGQQPGDVDSDALDALQDLARSYRDLLRAAIVSESDYINALEALNGAQIDYRTQLSGYRDFLASKLLWIPNHPPLWLVNPRAVGNEFAQLRASLDTIEVRLNLYTAFALLLAALLWQNGQRLRNYQEAMNARIARPRTDAIRFTMLALLAATLRALTAPLVIMAFVAAIDASASAAGNALSNVLTYTALLAFSFDLMRRIAEPAGIGEIHFGWPAATLARLRQELSYLLRWWIPFMAAGAIASRLTPDSGAEVLGRSLILVSLLMIMAHFGGHMLRELRATGRVWFAGALNRLRVLLMLIFLLMLGSLVYGHVYSLRVIVASLIDSIWIGIALLLIHALLMRWVRVVRRRLRMQGLLALRAQEGDQADSTSIEEQESSIGDISSDTRQLLHMATLVGALVALIWIWGPLLPAFAALSDVELWTSTSSVEGETAVTRITLATLVIIGFVGALTLFAAQRLPALVEIVLRSRTTISPGARYTISALLNYVIIGGGVIVALSALGLKWEQLQWLVAALGVGIGFGLQEIVANFISGLIILFERPIRVGDVVTIGDTDGTVTRIRIRATTLRDWDGKELLVPNKEFITGRLLNWSLSDSETRIVINVGIAYGSDVEQAVKLLRDVIVSHSRTLDEPAPLIVFENFGDNALELSARAFVATLTERLAVMTELRTAIYRAFNDAGIVIAFPQRDVHLTMQEPLAVTFDPSSAPDVSKSKSDP